VRDLQAARRAPLNPSPPLGAEGSGRDEVGAGADEHTADAAAVPDEATGPTGLGATALPVPSEHRLRLWPLFSTVALVGLSLDVVTKVFAVRELEPGVGVPFIGNLLTLRLIRNPGAAFSQGEGFAWVFAVAAVLVLAFVGVRLVPRLGHVGWAVALGLLVAGVSGNLADRIFRAPAPFRGHVVDFLQLPHWPIFNVADLCITSAAVMVVVLSVIKNVGLDGHRPGDEDEPGTTPADAASA
jgi:signal peptidase II